jgi:hypothetical protein
VSAAIERFGAQSDPDAIHRALVRDGVAIVEHLLTPEVVQQVNEEVESAVTAPRRAQEPLGYAMHNGISRGGGYLGMLHMQDPVGLLARGRL